MKNLSKVLAVVLAFAMALSMVSFAAYTDVKAGDSCEEAVTVLSALEILKGYEDGSFKPEATITRAEFATVVIRLLGLADSASATATMFNDVAADHWASGAIALASQQGIVNGYGDGNFGPEDPVKYNEAIKMIVAALGYTPMADANGGWPGGFQVVASQKGILAGISGIGASAEAPRGVVAQLAYNALTVPLMEQTGFGTQTNFATVGSLLLNKLGITKFEGVVTGTSLSENIKDGKVKVEYNYQITAIAGQSTAKKYDPASDNAIYCNPVVPSATPTIFANGDVEEAAKELIDVASVMYVKNADSDKAELVCIMKDGSKNETIAFMTEDLKENAALAVEDGKAAGTLEVYTDVDAGDYEEYALNIGKVYINGRTTAIDEIGSIDAGEKIDTAAEIEAVLEYYLKKANAADVTLLSQEEDEFNVAYITVYQDVKVKRIAASTSKVSFTPIVGPLDYISGSNIILDEEDKDLKFTIYKDGEVISLDEVAEDDILSIAGYVNGENELAYGSVYVTTEKVEGKVTSRSASANKITVDGETYKANSSVISGTSLGDQAVFFKNIRGVLVAVDTTATAANVKLGFATYIREYDADYGEPAQLRVLTAEGKWETINFATNVSIDGGARAASKSIAWDDLEAGNSTGNKLDLVDGSATKWGVNEVVAYDLNASGEIAKLFLNDVTDYFVAEGATGTDLEFDADTLAIGDDFVADDAVIFSVPAGVKGVRDNDTEEDDVKVVAIASLADGDELDILGSYNYNDDGAITVLLGENVASSVDWASNFFVVSDDAMESTNEAGEAGIILKGLVAGEETTLFINTDELDCDVQKADFDNGSSADVEEQLDTIAVGIDTFAKGDVLLYTLDAKNEAANIIILVSAADVAKDAPAAYGYLNTIDGNADGDTVVATITGNTTIKFIAGYAAELKEGDRGNYTFMAEDLTSAKTYAFASDVIGTRFDKYVGTNGRLIEETQFGIESDSDLTAMTEEDGDFVFARMVGSRIVEFVAFANNN